MQSQSISEKKIYKCDKCKDKGVILINYDTAKQCECVKREARRSRLKKLNNFAAIPEDFKGLRLKDFRIDIYDNQALAATVKKLGIRYIQKFQKIETKGKGLYFYSNTPGSGKTRLAITLGNEILSMFERAVRYTTVDELTRVIKSTFNSKASSNEKDIVESFKKVDVLILDDLGVENLTDWTQSVLYSILNYRVDNKKVTLFTSNTSIDDLQYHERVKSRIRKMAIPVAFPEESVRETISEEENKEILDMLFE